MNWNAVAGANHYDVRVREVGTTSWRLFTNVTFTYKNKYGLTQASTYEWQVRTACTSDSSSVSAWSALEVFNTLTPCVMPTNLNSLPVTSATLDWDDVPGAWGYKQDINLKEVHGHMIPLTLQIYRLVLYRLRVYTSGK